MVRRIGIAAGVLGVCLGCSGELGNELRTGVEQGAERSFDRQFRATFTSACMAQTVGPVEPDLQRRVCGCVADELVITKTPSELAGLISSPSLPEIQPVIEACGRKLAR